MADVIDHEIYGDDMQLVEIELDPGEKVRAEAGTITYKDAGIEMQTSTDSGIFKGFKRAVTGESFFMTTFLNNGSGKQQAAIAAPYPGKIIPINLNDFGGEGLFLARLTGPGKVYLQSLSFSPLADCVLASARFQQTGEKRGAAGVGGDNLGDLLSGR
jgi:uncharacterized protein (AIM24 family)